MRQLFRTAFLTCLAVLSITACSTVQREILENPVFYPGPPEPPRIQYLTSISNSVDVMGRLTMMQALTGQSGGKPIIKPYGISVSSGKIYVCDTILGGLEIIDLKKRSFNYFQPRGVASFRKPINCFKDKEDRLYVTDAERRQVVVFDNNNKYVGAFGDEDLKKPTDVFVTEDEIYVCDIKLQKIVVYAKKDFTRLRYLPDSSLEGDESIFSPTNIYVKDDRLYVSDFGDFKIKTYTTDGKFISALGSYGQALGQFVRPKGIAVDMYNNIYVADSGFENVQVFNEEGKLLLFFGGSYEGPGDMWLPAKVIIDYDNMEYFQQYVHQDVELKYLILVTNQYGPAKVNVYGFVEPKPVEEKPDSAS